MNARQSPMHVSLVAIPEVTLSTLTGIYDVLNCFEVLGSFDDAVPKENPFRVEIVAPTHGASGTASGLPLAAHRTFDEVARTDIVIVPSMMLEGAEWTPGCYPDVVDWLSATHAGGAMLCSACSGVLLLAETGLLDGRDATIHWAYARTFQRNFPNVELSLEKVLVVTGERQQFVMSGASASWHDLVLYLVARLVGPAAATAITKFMLLQWHVDGQAPYVVFEAPTDHGDAIVLEAQEWLGTHFAVATPVEEMVTRSSLAERTFKRRFTKATGYSPIAYVQHLRVEEAKRRLERTDEPVDKISWAVGYEDPAFFRRLFKRITRITPGAYRRRFKLPDFGSAGRSVDWL
ncbi:MAG: helix-turn-helix domain-containing protein [Gemmatimonadetes bacterium]|nr:helix-turn-helix domain-containing protein [Gemmatimonadota bacterium]NIO30921.1 helix-turn-helix domain-containing protein [Gemmatimonadota bacterium]